MNEINKSDVENTKSFEEERRNFLELIDYINRNSNSEENEVTEKEREMMSELKRHGLI